MLTGEMGGLSTFKIIPIYFIIMMGSDLKFIMLNRLIFEIITKIGILFIAKS